MAAPPPGNKRGKQPAIAKRKCHEEEWEIFRRDGAARRHRRRAAGDRARPGGGPWSTRGGAARADLASGNLEFEVRGLVLAGGNSIGTPDAILQVKGTL